MIADSSHSGRDTAIGALRSTVEIIRQESDRFTIKQLVKSLALLIVGSISSALTPVAYKLIIDALSSRPATDLRWSPTSLVLVYVILLFALTYSTALRQLVHGTGVQRLSRRLSDRLFAHIMRLPLRFHLDRKTGAIGETLSQGLSSCQVLLQHAVFTIFPVVVEFIAIVVVLIHLKHSAYFLLIAVSTVTYGYTFWRAAEGVSGPSEQVSTAHIDSNATLTDSLLNYETVKYFDGESTICDRYDRTLETLEDSWRKLLRLKMGYELLLGTIQTASIGASLGFTAHATFNGQMSIGDFVLINTYVARLFQPLQAIGLAARDMSQSLAFLQSMLALLRQKPEMTADDEGVSPSGDTLGDIEFDRVSFSYGPDRPILKDVSFSVKHGQTVAIVGASGSGKSSLIRLLFRLYEPDSGQISLDGRPIADITLSRLRRTIGIVPQDTMLFNDTLGENITFGKHEASQSDIEHATKLAHLHPFICGLTEGYSTEVGERGLKLSGGEKQRVSIARAALKKPAIYVFDEATSSLDSHTEQEILQNLIDVSKRKTTLIIAHRLSTIVHADTIVVLDKGTIVERGSHGQLLQRDGAYASLWRAQHSRQSDDRSHQASSAA